jgi:hypothetical protein
MKQSLLFLSATLSLLFFTSKGAFAQNQPMQVVSNTGAGYSTMFGILVPDAVSIGSSAISNSAGITENESTSILPAISETVDLGLSNKFSLGIGAAYQSATASFSNYTNSVTNEVENFTETVQRTSIGIRGLFHSGTNSKFDPYAGFRLGISMWSIGNNSNDPNFSGYDLKGTLPCFQFLAGFRYYFSPIVGFHMEGGIGTPYLIEAGVSVKFGGLPAMEDVHSH